MRENQTLYFYIFVFSLFLGICSPHLFSHGMFMDGLLYATISKNLADGLGNIWNLHLTNTLFPEFHEHPPLVFGIQSLFFKLFGESFYIEKIYSFATFIIVGLIIIAIWKEIANDKSTAWIPLFLWITIPLVTWAAKNNMLENTMSIFVCLATLFYLKSLRYHRYIFLIFTGLSLASAFLSKGFVSLFIWTFPLWTWLCLRKISFSRMIADSFLTIVLSILPLAFLFLVVPESSISIQKYFINKVLHNISVTKFVPGRFYILYRLFNELLISIIIVSLIIFIGWRKKEDIKLLFTKQKLSLTFFLLGLSGVLPIMISMKQSGFYILSTFPFFAISFGLLVSPFLSILIDNIDQHSKKSRYFEILSISLLLISISISIVQFNRIGRDKAKIEMIFDFIKILPRNSTINIDSNLWSDWGLHGYFGRYANISLDPQKDVLHNFFLTRNKEKSIPKRYIKIREFNDYLLYKRE